ncbi:low affinity Fe/Cu permease [Actinoplanes lutulentus]|uniref:Uncharacterized protein n=1 Tax=Actinoplanes lutulentus TaxID=1287878 RepID=A0A327Z1V4_9ACTN|nr:hypothetical protein [Actinoplanes lutulentus]MBB2943367.1 low affinity Fe/Cu permease [Actinoplanes lutulentus]RAK28425.1 hypothetical protein B0I29_120193 [Actinoplanes lutulentus]
MSSSLERRFTRADYAMLAVAAAFASAAVAIWWAAGSLVTAGYALVLSIDLALSAAVFVSIALISRYGTQNDE